MKNSINIFSETGCIQHEVLWKYRQGKLTAAEKHAVEVHLTDCELCSDALAGMMALETDEMIAGLRKGVRNISAPKKVIRFYDYRILSAAAAVAAVFFVFKYVINSSEKQDRKEIAQLLNIEPKDEQASIDIGMPHRETGSVALESKKVSDIKEKAANNTYNITLTDSISGYTAVAAEPDKEAEETTIANNVTSQDADAIDSYTAPAPSQAASGNYSRSEEKAAAVSTKSALKKKTAGDESPKVTYFNDLKVSRTPAMGESENFDSVNTGTPAMYENDKQKDDQFQRVREMPFVYSKTLRDGMNYFHNKQYEAASQTFTIILERFPNDVNAQFYKGLSEMEMRNYSSSKSLLTKAIENTDKTFYEEAKFKLALCYVAMNKTDDAEKLLLEIATGKGFYSHQATEELQRLKYGESGK